ncbi:DUF523 domain-containing protein [Achromobacter sp. Marseille-Q4962]|uniref:DUF523 domain-containing protein n=1 Tax=Achromobacter sp. Marseille-Q4962 TaxID=2942202 RepID=UPI0020732C60|nr:DUF523 domain-containing protein [Achromobacter sp. Marseille-Q4962]
MFHVLVSSCLLGNPVRYDGRGAARVHPVLAEWRAQGRVVALCPEMAGGLPVPRPPAEIEPGADARAVLEGRARVLTLDGGDAGPAFVRGARAALQAARERDIRIAVLKEGSPSCGSGYVYDGTHTGARQPGAGVTAWLLRQAGLRVFSEHEWESAQTCLRELEAGLLG